jgi:hypothetical protein
MPALEPRLAIRAIDSLHLFVRDISSSREHFVERLGFRQAGLSGAELQGQQGLRASMLESGGARLVLMTPLTEQAAPATFLRRRDSGIGRVVLEVENAEQARDCLVSRGGRLQGPSCEQKVGLGRVRWFDVATPCDETQLRFVQYQDCRKVLPGLICRAPRKTHYGAFGVGRLVGVDLRCRDREPGLRDLRQLLGFERVPGSDGLLRDPVSGIELGLHEAEAMSFAVEQLATSAELMVQAGAHVIAESSGLVVPSALDDSPLSLRLRAVDPEGAAAAERAA